MAVDDGRRAGSEAVLVALEHEWARARLELDVAALDRLRADEWVETTPSGRLLTKAQTVELVASGDHGLREDSIEDLEVRVHGDTAIVTGRETIAFDEGGREVRASLRFTDTWLLRKGRWRAVATHLSKVPEPPPG